MLIRSFLTRTLTLGLLVAAAAPLRAETASYPEKDPAFTVEVPEGWGMKRDNGALMLTTKDDAAFLFQQVTDVHDAKTAKAGLPNLAAAAAKVFKLKEGATVTAPPAAMDLGDIKAFGTEYKGKDADNEDAFWQVVIFSPADDKDYYVMTAICSDKTDKKTAPARDAIVKSIKPAGDDADSDDKDDEDDAKG